MTVTLRPPMVDLSMLGSGPPDALVDLPSTSRLKFTSNSTVLNSPMPSLLQCESVYGPLFGATFTHSTTVCPAAEALAAPNAHTASAQSTSAPMIDLLRVILMTPWSWFGRGVGSRCRERAPALRLRVHEPPAYTRS